MLLTYSMSFGLNMFLCIDTFLRRIVSPRVFFSLDFETNAGSRSLESEMFSDIKHTVNQYFGNVSWSQLHQSEFLLMRWLSWVWCNKRWSRTRIHRVHSIHRRRRWWAVTNWDTRGVVRSNATSLYLVSEMYSFANVFSFPFCASILKPSLDLFVA